MLSTAAAWRIDAALAGRRERDTPAGRWWGADFFSELDVEPAWSLLSSSLSIAARRFVARPSSLSDWLQISPDSCLGSAVFGARMASAATLEPPKRRVLAQLARPEIRFSVLVVKSTKGPMWGIPCSFLEPFARSWSHYVGIYRQKLTRSRRIDFEIPPRRTLGGDGQIKIYDSPIRSFLPLLLRPLLEHCCGPWAGSGWPLSRGGSPACHGKMNAKNG